jgi:hypothetical protein
MPTVVSPQWFETSTSGTGFTPDLRVAYVLFGGFDPVLRSPPDDDVGDASWVIVARFRIESGPPDCISKSATAHSVVRMAFPNATSVTSNPGCPNALVGVDPRYATAVRLDAIVGGQPRSAGRGCHGRSTLRGRDRSFV